jgi:hypothetical protein
MTWNGASIVAALLKLKGWQICTPAVVGAGQLP